MKPDNEYNRQRTCKFCRVQTKMHIRLEEWVVVVTCSECTATYELPRF